MRLSSVHSMIILLVCSIFSPMNSDNSSTWCAPRIKKFNQGREPYHVCASSASCYYQGSIDVDCLFESLLI
ncbi:hypothetical protein KP509_11G078700 [Ceratopteris richardii]|uniref:Uncharacterized protein n=1 Tax=Ceratopteris richardii TaxID=49495 RepID=A0A8T2TX72_CERRI|nr:hypothetical protein KP509_11G078700 [Ceratopteris richardii]